MLRWTLTGQYGGGTDWVQEMLWRSGTINWQENALQIWLLTTELLICTKTKQKFFHRSTYYVLMMKLSKIRKPQHRLNTVQQSTTQYNTYNSHVTYWCCKQIMLFTFFLFSLCRLKVLKFEVQRRRLLWLWMKCRNSMLKY